MGSSSDGDESVLADESHRSPQRLCRRRRGKDREEKPAPPPEERATRSAAPPIDGAASRGTKKLVVDLIAAALLVRERERSGERWVLSISLFLIIIRQSKSVPNK
jgi:hypothetical protein